MSLLSNLLCLWLVSVVFALGLLSVLIAAAVPQLGAACAFVPALGIRAVLSIAGLLEELPFHAIYFNTAFSVAWLAYVYAIFIACALAKRGKYRYFAAVGLSVLSLFAAAKVNALHYEQGGLNVVALDVGQGESVLLISEGHAALVDCGSKNSYIDAGAIAADYLRSAGATLDSVVLTHYHEDHANGLAALFARVDVDTIYLADIDAGEGDRDEVEALGRALRREHPLCHRGDGCRKRCVDDDDLSAARREGRKRAGIDDPVLARRFRHAHHRRYGRENRDEARRDL